MENLHAPTVPSGQTNGVTTNGTAGHLSLAELQRKKADLEQELQALGGVLESQGVNMQTPLITSDGFPRSDIDVAKIRTTRARIMRLKNDYADLMVEIEKHLHQHFANLDEDNESDSSPGQPVVNGVAMLSDSVVPDLDEPFAKVNTVAPGSPADRAGLKQGDMIRNFGYVNKTNHDSLSKVAECVQGNEGRNIFVKVSRASDATQRQELRLTLTPTRDWGGRGLLGCHIVPL
ncbi:hypothetical protein E4U55_007247 [Claviceps digitariae]|nr:hypothetical protein E4U55_007247 [Claviceps digitariae]